MLDKYNQEEPSTLQKIQNQTGCLFLVIGVAMLAFVLTDLLSSGSSIFGSNENSVGSIGDENVSYEEFNQTYEGLKFQIQQNNPGFQFNEAMSAQYRQQAWNILVENKTLKPQFDKIGIQVSAAELEDLTIGANTHPQIQQSFRNPETNQFEKNRLLRFLKEDINNNEAARQSWISFQNQFTDGLISEKYNALVISSFYTTSLEANTNNDELNRSRNISLVAVPYNQKADSTITVSDNEILTYAKAHRSEFEQKASRSIEYVKLNVVPSEKDTADMSKWASDAADRFRQATDDSTFVSIMNSQTPFDPTYRGRGTFARDVEDSLFSVPVGTVIGPLKKNGVYTLFKVTGIGSDSTGKTIQVAILDQSIYASTTTDNSYYSIAGQILTKVNGDKTFEEVVEQLGLPKGVASGITEKNRTIPGIPKADKIARWIFDPETEEGDISNIIDLNGSYVVARVTKINEAGIPDASDLRNRIESLVRNQKIADKIAPQMEEALESAKSADELATAMDVNTVPLPAVSFSGSGLPYIGQDGQVTGAVFGTPVGSHSNVIKGKNALAVVYVNNDNESPSKDLEQIRSETTTLARQTAQGLIKQALEKSANVTDQRYKFFDN